MYSNHAWSLTDLTKYIVCNLEGSSCSREPDWSLFIIQGWAVLIVLAGGTAIDRSIIMRPITNQFFSDERIWKTRIFNWIEIRTVISLSTYDRGLGFQKTCYCRLITRSSPVQPSLHSINDMAVTWYLLLDYPFPMGRSHAFLEAAFEVQFLSLV